MGDAISMEVTERKSFASLPGIILSNCNPGCF